MVPPAFLFPTVGLHLLQQQQQQQHHLVRSVVGITNSPSQVYIPKISPKRNNLIAVLQVYLTKMIFVFVTIVTSEII